MLRLITLTSILAVLVMSIGPADARLSKSFLNRNSENPPVPTDRGVILGSLEETVKTLGIISSAPQVQLTIKTASPIEPIGEGLLNTIFQFAYDDHEQASAMPGEYALRAVHWSSEAVTWLIGGWYRPEPVGTFSLAAGEVIYIGHLVFEPGNATFGFSEDNKILKMRVEDRFEEYKQDLPPHLRDKVQKRLIDLPEQMEFPNSTRTRVRR